MSNKRGRRNGRWHKEKANRRLQEKRDDLRKQSREVEYVPLEKPIFAGWDLSIGLTESGMRRKDSQEIQEVINILNESRQIFTRDIKYIRHIRNNDHSLDSIKSYYQNRGYFIDYFSNRHITWREYHNLPQHLKEWFYEDRYYKYSSWMHRNYYYGTVSNFPWYEVRVVITRSYYHYKKVYNTVAQSEYDKLDGDLYLVNRKTWGRDKYRDSFVDSNKAAWKNSLRRIISSQYTPDEIIDNCSKIFKGTNDKKDYGWS